MSNREKVNAMIDLFENAKFEGYWNDERNNFPNHTIPVHSDTVLPDKAVILQALDVVEPQAETFRYMGFSVCRCCGVNNGSAEFYLKGWRWPIGFRHYVEVHNVSPTETFRNEILKI